MKRLFIRFLVLVLVFGICTASIAKSKSNGIYLEVLGRAGFYCFSYERSLNSLMDLGVGISYTPFPVRWSVVMPLYLNLFFIKKKRGIFFTGGASPYTYQSDSENYYDYSVSFGIGYDTGISGFPGWFFAPTRIVVYVLRNPENGQLVPWLSGQFGFRF